MSERGRVRRRRPGPVPALLVVLALLGTGGCAGIPETGPVLDGRAVEGVSDRRARLYPARPTPGATPVDLVRGFLRASADFSDDNAVARSFLSAGITTSWRPAGSVVVYPGDSVDAGLRVDLLDAGPVPGPAAVLPRPERAGTPATEPRVGERRTVRVQVPVESRVDGQGRRRPAARPAEVETRTFDLVAERVAGTVQWRIARLDDGVLVTSSDFDAAFDAVPLYFADPQGDWLVPDLRWFPFVSAATPALVVTALLDGPSEWLARGGAVRTVVPAGTELSDFGVQLDPAARTARVDLTSGAVELDTRELGILERQILESLRALQNSVDVLDQVVVTLNRVPLQVAPPSPGPSAPSGAGEPAGTRPPALLRWQPSGASILALDARGRVSRLASPAATAPGLVTGLPGLAALAGPDAEVPTVGPGQVYAVLRDGRSRLLAATGTAPAVELLRVPGATLTPPSVDPQGWVWSTPRRTRGSVLATHAGSGTPARARVEAPWLRGEVLALRISGDGARALVLVRETPTRTRLYVSAVEREGGRPRSLGAGELLVPDLVSATDAVWSDDLTVAVLGSRPRPGGQDSAREAPWLVTIGGEVRVTQDLPPGESGAGLAVGPGGQPLLVQTRKGAAADRVLVRSGSGYVPLPGIRWPFSES